MYLFNKFFFPLALALALTVMGLAVSADGETALVATVGTNMQASLRLQPAFNYYPMPIHADVRSTALQVWAGNSSISGTSLEEILHDALRHLEPLVDFIKAHPVLTTVLVLSVLDGWFLPMLGFQAAGIAAGSIAAAVQSHIGNVPKDSLFAFLQSNGAGGFAKVAMGRAKLFIVVAVVLASVGMLLLTAMIDHQRVEDTLLKAWNNFEKLHQLALDTGGDPISRVENGALDILSRVQTNAAGGSVLTGVHWLVWGVCMVLIWARN